MTSDLVLAGGGVVRRAGPGGTEVLVVHRPRYDDWTLPKGKLDAVDRGDVEACALREVREETGYSCVTVAEVGETTYPTQAKGGGPATKVVRYWLMEVEGGEFGPNREVDEVRWLSQTDAAALLSYERDRDLLKRSLQM